MRVLGGRTKPGEVFARSCVDRALDKMRIQFGRRGIASTAAGIAVALESQVLTAAPAAWVVGMMSEKRRTGSSRVGRSSSFSQGNEGLLIEEAWA
jgi:hypothetical protein